MAVSVSGKPNFAARDKGAEIAAGSARPFDRDQAPARKPANFGPIRQKLGKSPFEWDCVVGPGGRNP